MSNQTLVLQKITRKSAGNYSCIASNDEGENQSEPFYLDVKCKYVLRELIKNIRLNTYVSVRKAKKKSVLSPILPRIRDVLCFSYKFG